MTTLTVFLSDRSPGTKKETSLRYHVMSVIQARCKRASEAWRKWRSAVPNSKNSFLLSTLFVTICLPLRQAYIGLKEFVHLSKRRKVKFTCTEHHVLSSRGQNVCGFHAVLTASTGRYILCELCLKPCSFAVGKGCIILTLCFS